MTPERPTAEQMAVDLGRMFSPHGPLHHQEFGCVAAKRALFAETQLERAKELLRDLCQVTAWEDRIEAAKFLEETQ